MGNLIQWERPSMLGLQRDIDDILEDFGSPRNIRREVTRLFDDVMAPRPLWRAIDRIFDVFESPLPLRRRVARLFEDLDVPVSRTLGGTTTAFVPSLDLVEHDNEYVLRADLPGLREQDVDVRMDDKGTLTISGERQDGETRRGAGYEYYERSYGAFSRSVSLPAGVDTSHITANFDNGVLEIHAPKLETARARKIPLLRGESRSVGPTGEPVIHQPQVS